MGFRKKYQEGSVCCMTNRVKPVYSFLIILFSFSFFSSCETDLEVNAPYKELTVVYGLLDQNESYHFIKINKSFLGEADAYSMASVRDSSEYNDLTAEVEERKYGIATGRNWLLLDSVFTNKEAGDFYFPQQKIYYFIEDSLDAVAQYHLNISINGGAKTVTAKTDLINGIDDFTGGYQFVIPCGGGQIEPCVGFATTGEKYIDKAFTWRSVKDGKRYQLVMTVFYQDELAGSLKVNKSLKWVFQPPLVTSSLGGGEEMTVTINGEDFYRELNRQLTPLTDASIIRRFFVNLEFTVYVAADDLNTYLLANEPSTGIIQEKPEFTNIENGIGIFSSRYSKTSPKKLLDEASLLELVKGKHTFTLRFCKLNPSDGSLICN